MNAILSAIYPGTVMHQRVRPRRHRLTYRMFWLLLDLDEIDALSGSLRLFSRNRFNLFSFFDRDHGGGASLRAHVDGRLARAGLETGGMVQLLSMPRILGYVFNPLSIYFCRRRDGALQAMLYEVNNTFGERHSYLIPIEGDAGETIQQACEKRFHVSPFMAMDIAYRFRIGMPGQRLSVHITGSDAEGPMIVAAFSGRREALSDGALARTFLSHPLLTLKVVGGIHWEALRLWLKGIRLHPHPSAPDAAVTYVSARRSIRREVRRDVV